MSETERFDTFLPSNTSIDESGLFGSNGLDFRSARMFVRLCITTPWWSFHFWEKYSRHLVSLQSLLHIYFLLGRLFFFVGRSNIFFFFIASLITHLPFLSEVFRWNGVIKYWWILGALLWTENGRALADCKCPWKGSLPSTLYKVYYYSISPLSRILYIPTCTI